MGRAGIEPATLGLKVRPKKLRPSARSSNSLQIARVVVAANCNEACRIETSVYARFLRALIVQSDDALVSAHLRGAL